ncbi:MAG: 2-amino-4-hydroxy-6-hydroxymethyldihydropteridine diphosphokinase [bacterium]|nr:2-amino-4-hydroxy-6-hydroxymethyldihydropteridine diphosphokinase [bacterium]
MALGLGSNLGNRYQNLYSAIIQLELDGVVFNSIVSSIYETEPWGKAEGNNFLNLVVLGNTDYLPNELLRYTQQLEFKMGRTSKGNGYSPRIIDIDILLYGEMVIQSEDLIIPHPKLLERKFVLIPFNEIAPDLKIAGTDWTIQQALQSCKDHCKVYLVNLGE